MENPFDTYHSTIRTKTGNYQSISALIIVFACKTKDSLTENFIPKCDYGVTLHFSDESIIMAGEIECQTSSLTLQRM